MTGKPSSPAAMAAINHGLTGLQEMEKLSGVPRRTLSDWHKFKPVTFETMAMGCKVKKGNQNAAHE
jgi:hypothetical protein